MRDGLSVTRSFKQRAATFLWWFTAACFACLAILHLSMCLAYAMPLTPVKSAFWPTIRDYIQPKFTQNWAFFAPAPPANDRWVIARVRIARPGGHSVQTDWNNVTAALDQAVADNRLTPMESIHLLLANSLSDYQNELSRTPALRGAKLIPAKFSALNRLVMYRIATAVFEQAHPKEHIESIQLAILAHDYPRFTKRFSPDKANYQMLLIQWQPVTYVTPFLGAI